MKLEPKSPTPTKLTPDDQLPIWLQWKMNDKEKYLREHGFTVWWLGENCIRCWSKESIYSRLNSYNYYSEGDLSRMTLDEVKEVVKALKA